MKATLEFDINDVDDRMAHYRCVKALDMAIVLWEIKVNILNPKHKLTSEEIADKINELYHQHNIDIDQIIT